ncbi:LXG domain-containing protein [Bombilactobacillus thymidiniphilus]|uniref:LXG domain-containing protein n=1 Tax=Bombilactobacillus thymidiniphilus TaxID=2923363 RepID=A0ABY4PBA8_9LACO|nr:LXG domain-containing protein [Bombilactobacillus thymidiniphilus]UQS83058.1 LXG domain-containing protein [Bombilactobacillus thymidiniphilus]
MSLIYYSSESAKLIKSLKSNLQASKKTVASVKDGIRNIIAAVDGKKLSGKSYTAAKNVFGDLILPTMAQVTNGFDDIQTELKKYESANKEIENEGDLNEDKLLRQINLKKNMRSSLEDAANLLKKAQNKLDTSGIQKTMGNMMQDLTNDIHKLEKKLDKLRTFSSTTKGLFSDSLHNLDQAVKKLAALKKTVISSDGHYEDNKSLGKLFSDDEIKEINSEFLDHGSEALEKLSEFSKKKNIGLALGARLQPRKNGSFVKSKSKARNKAISFSKSSIRKYNNPISIASNIGSNFFGVLGKILDFMDMADDFNKFNNRHHNVGRGMVYAAGSKLHGDKGLADGAFEASGTTPGSANFSQSAHNSSGLFDNMINKSNDSTAWYQSRYGKDKAITDHINHLGDAIDMLYTNPYNPGDTFIQKPIHYDK